MTTRRLGCPRQSSLCLESPLPTRARCRPEPFQRSGADAARYLHLLRIGAVGGRWTTRRCPRPRGRLGTAASRRARCRLASVATSVRDTDSAGRFASGSARSWRPVLRLRVVASLYVRHSARVSSEGAYLAGAHFLDTLARVKAPLPARRHLAGPQPARPSGRADTPASTRWVTGRKPSPQAAAAACAAP